MMTAVMATCDDDGCGRDGGGIDDGDGAVDGDQVVGNSLRGVEEEIGVISSEVDDEDMIFPCLEVTLKVLYIPFFISNECEVL